METTKVIWCEMCKGKCERITRGEDGETNTVCAKRLFGWDINMRKVTGYDIQYCPVIMAHQEKLLTQYESDVSITAPSLERSPQRGDGYITQETLRTNRVIFIVDSTKPIEICYRNGKKVK